MMHTTYFLTQLLDTPVYWKGKKTGKLSDIVITDREGAHPRVESIVVSRPYGDPSLTVPIEAVDGMDSKRIVMTAESLDAFMVPPSSDAVLLRDHILDKKVLDTEDHEVQVVYDIKMTQLQGGLYVTDVDMSRYGLLRRLGLKWLADLIYRPKERPNPDLISWKYIQALPQNIDSFKGNVKLTVLKEHLHDIDPVDLADIIEELDPSQRAAVFGELDVEHASDTLEEIDPNVQRQLVSTLKTERVAQLINEMTPAQAADVLAVLPSHHVDDIMPLLDKENARKITSIMEHQETSIMNFVTPDCIRFSPDMTVARVEEEFPQAAKGKDINSYIYVIDEAGVLLGVVDLKRVLLADDSRTLREIMDDNVITLNKDESLKEAARMFKHYHFQALPVVDSGDVLLGVMLYRDVIELKHHAL
jgi:CBS domain-containing protein